MLFLLNEEIKRVKLVYPYCESTQKQRAAAKHKDKTNDSRQKELHALKNRWKLRKQASVFQHVETVVQCTASSSRASQVEEKKERKNLLCYAIFISYKVRALPTGDDTVYFGQQT